LTFVRTSTPGRATVDMTFDRLLYRGYNLCATSHTGYILRRVAMTNPFVSLKRLFEGTPVSDGSLQGDVRRVEKNFMKYDLTADGRF
jgi:hypothetical protein